MGFALPPSDFFAACEALSCCLSTSTRASTSCGWINFAVFRPPLRYSCAVTVQSNPAVVVIGVCDCGQVCTVCGQPAWQLKSQHSLRFRPVSSLGAIVADRLFSLGPSFLPAGNCFAFAFGCALGLGGGLAPPRVSSLSSSGSEPFPPAFGGSGHSALRCPNRPQFQHFISGASSPARFNSFGAAVLPQTWSHMRLS